MSKILLSLFILLSSIVMHTNAFATIQFSNGMCQEPNQEIIVEGNMIHVKYEFPEISKVQINGEDSCILFSVPGFGNCLKNNIPAIPSRIDTFRIPNGYSVKLSYKRAEPREYLCKYACVSEWNGQSEPQFKAIHDNIGIYPSENISINREYENRGEHLIEISTCPVQFDSSNGTSYIYSEIEYTLTFYPEVEEPFHSLSTVQSVNNSFLLEEELKKSHINEIAKIGEKKSEDGNVGYLIVSTEKFRDSRQRFIQWKQTQGFTVHVLSPASWNEDADELIRTVREYISQNPEIQYILIVGDFEDVPAKRDKNIIGVYEPKDLTYITDSYLNSLTDDNPIADIFVGRVAVKTSLEAAETLDKIMYHEMCPPVDDHYYTHALHSSCFETKESTQTRENSRFILTSEEIRDYVSEKGIEAKRLYNIDPETSNAIPTYFSNYYGHGQEIPKEIQKPYFSWEFSPEDINDELNKGCLYALYNSHGWVGGWCHANYGVKDLSGLNNTDLYPLIINVICHAGEFSGTREEDLGECFAESILRLPDAGASCVIASTQAIMYGIDSSITEGIISSIWPTPGLQPDMNIPLNTATDKRFTSCDEIGKILAEGLYQMSQQCSKYYSLSTRNHHHRLLHIFGDPSMIFHTKKPKQFSDVEITKSNDGISIDTHGEMAYIGIHDFASGKTYRFKDTQVSISGVNPYQTSVCLTGQNYQTYLWGRGMMAPENDNLNTKIRKVNIMNDSLASVSIISQESDDFDICVFDILGQKVYSEDNCKLVEGKNILNIPLSKATGVYVIILSKNSKVIDTYKVFKR